MISSWVARTYYDISRIYYRHKWLSKRKIGEYSPSPDPTELRFVDPNSISKKHAESKRGDETKLVHKNMERDIGRVLGGEWDHDTVPVKNTMKYFKRFSDGIPWEKTEYYKRYLEKWDNPERDSTTIKYKNEEELQKRLNYLDRLYEIIYEEGYKTQRELIQNDITNIIFPFKYLFCNEVMVDIGRNGDFILVDARHRLAIAQALGLDQIPVGIVARHEEWMTKWERIANSESKDHIPPNIQPYINHPDFKYLIVD